MSRIRAAAARFLPFAVVVGLALTALQIKLPRVTTPPIVLAARARTTAADPLEWTQRMDTLKSGETLTGLLERGGAGEALIAGLLDAAADLDPRRLPAGMAVTMRSLHGDSLPSEIIFQLAVDRLLYLRRTTSGWMSEEKLLPWRTDTIVVGGVIQSTLYDALDSSAARLLPVGARAELAWSVADIYEYRVDMSRELKAGDAFRVLFLRSEGPGGLSSVRVGEVLAARFDLSGTPVEAVRFATGSARAEYFDQDGKSLRAGFLRSPVAFRRISSIFGMRRHPILGTWRQHKGTDYAASSGTRVRSVGDGVVQFAGRKGGYGNMVEVRHHNGYVTRYGHLRSFASVARRGRRIAIGQTVGSVGMSGLATAPHLHFEVLVHGVQRDPRVALNFRGGLPLAAKEHQQFEATRVALLALMDKEADSARVALR